MQNIFVFDTDIEILINFGKIIPIENRGYLNKNILLYIQWIMSLENFIPKGRIVENLHSG